MQKDRAKVELTQKREKYCNTICYHISKLEKLTNNNDLIALLGLKKVRILKIVIVSID